MPPRGSRAKNRTPQPVATNDEPDTGYRILIQQRLPEMPGRMSTAYGSAVTMNPRSPMRGQQRNLRSVVDRALDAAKRVDGEDDEDDEGDDDEEEYEEEEDTEQDTSAVETPIARARRSKTTEFKAPAAKAPAARAGASKAADTEQEAPAIKIPPAHKDPRIKTQPGSWVSMSPDPERTRRQSRAVSLPPESTPDKAPAAASPSRRAKRPTNNEAGQGPGRASDAPSLRSQILARNSRFGSEPPPDMDTSRSFANESVVFGDATLLSTPGSAGGSGRKGRGTASIRPALPNVLEESPQPTAPTTPRTRRSTKSSTQDESAAPVWVDTISSHSSSVSEVGYGGGHQEEDTPFQPQEEDESVAQVSKPRRLSRATPARAKPPTPQATQSRSTAAADLRTLKVEAEDESSVVHGIPETPGPSRPSGETSPARSPEPVSRADPAPANRQDRGSAHAGSGLRARQSAASRPASAREVAFQAEPVEAPARARWQHTPEPELSAGRRFFNDDNEEPGVRSWLSQEARSVWGSARKSVSWVYSTLLRPLLVLLLLAVLVRSFVPYGPHDTALGMFTPLFPWNWDKQVLILPDHEAAQFKDVLKRYEEKLHFLSGMKGLDREMITKVETLLPDVVHMERDARGRLTIPRNFWHALRDSIREDGAIMTFNKKGRAYQIDHDEHWIAIKHRIERDASLRPANETGDMEKSLDDYFSRAWEHWMRSNQKKVSGSDSQGNVVTRDEFMQKLKAEMSAAQFKFDAEFQSLSPKIDTLVQEAVKAATATRPPGGMTKTEVEGLVKKFVRRAISDANLEAISSGKINADHRAQLNQRINWANPYIGASIDEKRTSPDYKFIKGLKPTDPLVWHLRQNYFRPPKAALEPWDGEAECWCGANEGKDRKERLSRPVDLGILLPKEIVPTHLVVEHIPGTASVDPGARPKDIELWAYFEDTVTRERAKDFSAAFLPPTKESKTFAPPAEGFVKIGVFEWEDVPGHNGVQVFSLQDELAEINALTDTVIIRSTSNHGATDHTCFYRIRLFGQTEKDLSTIEQEKRKGRRN